MIHKENTFGDRANILVLVGDDISEYETNLPDQVVSS